MKFFLISLFFCSITLSKNLLEFTEQLENRISDIKRLNMDSKLYDKKVRENLYDIENWDVREYSIDDYLKNSAQTLNRLFKIKIALRKNLEQATEKNKIIINLYKKTLTSIRYIEDQISEQININTPIKKPVNLPFEHTVGFNQNQSGSDFSLNNLKSGDVLLVRGNSVTSSSIARISKTPSTHSHLALVYEDTKIKKFYLLEAMSHTGVIKTELSEALSEPLARISVYRHPNQELARNAAEFANIQFETAKAKGQVLKFDFSLDMTHNCRYFCSKFVSWVYQNESQNDLILPQFPSSIVRTNNAFKDRIAVKPSTLTSFLPSDIDTDSRFELINEYRNPEMTMQIRLDDLITDKIFEWIEKDDLDFKPNWIIKLFSATMSNFARNQTIHSLLNHVGVKLNPETPEELLSTMTIMLITVSKIKKEILLELEKHYGLPSKNISNKRIYNLIESYKANHPEVLKYFIKKNLNNLVSCRKYYL